MNENVCIRKTYCDSTLCQIAKEQYTKKFEAVLTCTLPHQNEMLQAMKQIVANVPCSCDEATAQHADAIFMQRMEDAIGSFGDAIQFFRGISMCFRFTACKLSSTWWLLEMGVPRARKSQQGLCPGGSLCPGLCPGLLLASCPLRWVFHVPTVHWVSPSRKAKPCCSVDMLLCC